MVKTKTKVGASFFALAFFMIITKNAYFFCCYILAVYLHEMSHDKMAKKLGYATKEIKLSAFGAVLYGDFDGVSFDDELKIAMAGPATKLCMAVCTLACWWVFPSLYAYTQPFYLANMCIFAINLLPCYPLDGGRIVFSFLGKRKGCFSAKKIFCRIGACVSFLFFAFFIFLFINGIVNITVALFSIFLFINSADMSTQPVYERIVGVSINKKRLKKGVEVKMVALSGENCVKDLTKFCTSNQLFNLLIVNDDMKVSTIYGFDEIEQILLDYPLETKLKQID